MHMTNIEWNKVTWYSKFLAVLVFIITFAVGFHLGIRYAQTYPNAWAPEAPVMGGTAGAHCGGFIKDAPTCAQGLHCQLNVNKPDTGGTCVKD
jgi:hypothetical protein